MVFKNEKTSTRHELIRGMYETHHDFLYSVLRARVMDHELAVDLLQETFLQAFRDISRFDSKRSHGDGRTWLYSIAVQQVKMHFRYRSAAKRAGPTTYLSQWELDHLPAPMSQSPVAQIEKTETIADLWKALGLLAERERELVILYHLRDYPRRELARLYDISETTVMRRLYSARRKLRQSLGKLIQEDSH